MTKVMAADFLARWPDLESLKRADANTLRSFFFKHNSRSHKTIEERLSAIAQATPLTTDPAIILPSSLRVLALAAMLKPLHRMIAKLDQQIEKTMDQHPMRTSFAACQELDLAW